MVTPDKPGGTPPKYGSGEKSRAKSAGYKLAGDIVEFPGGRKTLTAQDMQPGGKLDKKITADVLGRALGRKNILPIKPNDK